MNSERKLVYIVSPYAGDIQRNIEFAKAACRYCIDDGNSPMAVHLLYPQMLDDSIPKEREVGLALGRHVLEHCDEVQVFGDRISSGMAAEIKYAEEVGIPITYISDEQMLDRTDPVFAIWSRGTPGGPLAGESGFLCENRIQLFYSSEKEAETRIGDIRNQCLNNSPVAEYEFVRYPEYAPSDRRMHLEAIMNFDTGPAFNPDNFEIRSQEYGNTGGGCMVATSEVYLPELDRTVWINSNDESVTVTSADYVWNKDHSDSWERYEKVLLFSYGFQYAPPEDLEQWLSIIKEALAYNIEQEISYFKPGHTFSLPVSLLPGSIAEYAEPEYIEWLLDEDKYISIAKGGRIVIDEAYPQAAPLQPGITEMQ